MSSIPHADLPTGWNWVPLDSLAEILVSTVDKKSQAGETPVHLCNYTDVYYNDTITREIEFMQATASADQVSRFAVTAGDVPITKDSETSNDIGRPSFVPQTLPGVVYGYHLAIYRPHDPSIGPFIRYLFEESRTRGELQIRTPGVTRVGLSRDTLRNLRVPYPGPHVARKIADYLDHETTEIDALVADQQTTLNLLTARWESQLVRCVQQGIGNEVTATAVENWPHAPDSWTRTRLKSTIASASNGAWGTDPDTDDSTVRCIRVADFEKVHGSVHDRNVTKRSYPASIVASESLLPGDLILEKSGGGPTTPVGNVVQYTGPGGEMYSNFVARIKVASNAEPSYALRLHQMLYTSGVTSRSIKQATGIQNLDASSYFGETIFLPSRREQREIANHLEQNRRRIDELSADLTRAIALAKERRAALITAAVTGQIDVTARHRPAAEQLEDDMKELT